MDWMFQIYACWTCQIYGFVFQILDPKEFHPIASDHLMVKIKICYLCSRSHDLPRPVLGELYQLQRPIKLLPCHVSVQFDLSCVQNRPIYHRRNHVWLRYRESSTALSKMKLFLNFPTLVSGKFHFRWLNKTQDRRVWMFHI